MNKFFDYTIEDYIQDIEEIGLKSTWNKILEYRIDNDDASDILNVENFGELYEIGLEYTNKADKKEHGKYYTPDDVANVMSNWLVNLKGDNIADVACGCGNLILKYLEIIDKNARDKILNNKIYLYDEDETALNICKYSIAILYGKKYLNKVNCIKGDFLNKKITLPKDTKVLSNPPYYKISEVKNTWVNSVVINDSKEYYAAFMEKILKQSVSSVIITPYSFMGSEKFYSLRLLMNNYNGFIVSFDNVPGNIFNGRKHGIFNSNTSNSVRAAITVVENKDNKKGFMLSPLIRFKTEEREKVLNCKTLYNLLNKKYQIVSEKNKSYYKCFKNLEKVYEVTENSSNSKFKDVLATKKNDMSICVPTSGRYFMVASKRDLKRDGKRTFYVDDENYYDYIYCLFNSSFTYFYWRLYDGGINFPLSLIENIPLFYDKLSKRSLKKLHIIAKEMMEKEEEYLVYKMNAKKMQENIKFPKYYRDTINSIFLNDLGIKKEPKIFDEVHSSAIFKYEEYGRIKKNII